jgi:D-inositol-3-phosphate glycosyltransferase
VAAPTHVVGHVDRPATGTTVLAGSVEFSGWAVHRRRRLSAVALRINGSFAAIAPVDGSRPDVGAAHPDLGQAGTSGWTARVDLGRFAGSTVEVEAHALVEPEADAAGRWLPYASLTLDVAPDEGADRAVFVGPTLRPGAATVHGLAEARDGISHIEVSCDGVAAGRARILLPGHFEDGGSAHPLSGLARFECDVDVPAGRESVELTARVVTGEGHVFDARPWSAPVRPDEPTPSQPDRLERVAGLSDVLARAAGSAETSTAPGSPRVLVLAHDLGLGGGQLYLHDLLLGLAARGVSLAVTSLRGGILLPVLEELGIPVAVTGAFDPTDPEQYEAHVRQVMVFGTAHGCEVALANALPTFGAVDAAQRLGLQVVWALHESFPLDHFWNHAYGVPVAPHIRDRARGALAGTRHAVFEATATAEMYAPLLPAGAGAVVPYGVPLDEIDDYRAGHDRAQLRASLGFGEDTLVLVCVAMIEARKAQANLAAAFAGSSRLRDRDVELVLVGAQPHSPYVAQLADAVTRWGEHRIRIEPVQPDTYRWYHAADVLVSGSDIESLPRSMLEAMAFGRPVASTAVFGIPELVTDGDTGYLCRSRDVLAVREMLERVVDTPRDELAAMGLRASDTVRRRHDPAIYVEHYHRVLDDAAL